MGETTWLGPLFYPPVGKIAVTNLGARIEIWPNESDHAGCFTGLLLLDGRTRTQTIVNDLSCLWDRGCIVRIEEPTPHDLSLGMLQREAAV